VVSKVNATVNEILTSAETKASLDKLNVLLRPGSPQDFASFIKSDTPKWSQMVRESGATAQ
jgi:tripartite-type tricarboxylate transporter receptor subunit TctC